MPLKDIMFSAQHSSHFTIKDCINIYEWLLKCGRIKKGSAAETRLKHLRILHSKGQKEFKNKE